MADTPVLTVVQNNVGIVTPAIAGHIQGFINGYQGGQAPKEKSAEEKLIEKLRSQHEDYKHKVDHWRFLMLSYEGGPDYITGDTLFTHQRELGADFRERLRRAHYQNYCQPLVDFVPEFIFNQEIERDPGNDNRPAFLDFVANVDRAGTHLSIFMRQVAEDARIFGMTFVQLDKLPAPELIDGEELSLLKSQQLKLDIPYFISVSPLEILDWRTDARGNYVYLKRVQYLTQPEADGFQDIERYYEWMPSVRKVTDVIITDPKEPKIGNKIEEKNDWGLVPFIPIFYKRSKSNKDLGLSFLQDIAYQNNHVFNLTSLIDEFLYRQCFNILTMERDTAVPVAEQVEGNIGTSNVLDIPRDATHRPAYLTPPAEPAEFIQSERQTAIQEMYRQAAQDAMQELFGGKSGDAMKQGFARTIPVISKMADVLQTAEQKMFSMWAKLQDKEWKGKIAYKDDYSVTNLQDLLLQLSTIFNNLHVIPLTFVKEEWRRVVREFDGKISHDKMELILSEIDKLKDADVKGFYTQPDTEAVNGVPSTGNMIQGKEQKRLGSDKKRSLSTGDKSSTKEANPDSNKRASKGRPSGAKS